MSSRKSHVPAYRLHKQSGQAVVTLPDGFGNRRDVLLGQHGTAESRAEYLRVVAEWEANGRRLPRPASAPSDLSVNEMALAYWLFAETYYVKNGQPTSQLCSVKLALRPLKGLYGHTPAKDFGPLALKAVREQLVKLGWTRGYVNASIGCIKRAFKWAVENELVPGAVYQALQAVAGLKKGRSPAKEQQKVPPVPDQYVEAALPYLMPPLQAAVQVQRLSGMRPTEVLLMRPCDLDKSRGATWVYRPEVHKTEHHEVERVVFLGPKAQAVLKPFLDGRHPGRYLFSPKEGLAHFRALQRKARKTKVQPSQKDRRKKVLKRGPNDRYTHFSYAGAVDRATTAALAAAVAKARESVTVLGKPISRPEQKPLRKALREAVRRGVLVRLDRSAKGPEALLIDGKPCGIGYWHPNQLRHSAATLIRKEAGIDAARAQLGHSSCNITGIYAELDMGKAADVMERLG